MRGRTQQTVEIVIVRMSEGEKKQLDAFAATQPRMKRYQLFLALLYGWYSAHQDEVSKLKQEVEELKRQLTEK